MDIKILREIPPWEWPEDAGETFLGILLDRDATETDRLDAAELAGDFTVISDALAAALLAIVGDAGESEELRARAAIALGPVLEHADIEEFIDPEDVPISKQTFDQIQASLRRHFADTQVPKDTRRRILEASVRAPQDWHPEAVGAAYASGDASWQLTAVFCMGFIRGFDAQILAALESADPEIHYEAVRAAGNQEIDAAWPRIVDLVTSGDADKALLLAAIEAAACIRPHEAGEMLIELTSSADEDIADAAHEALAMLAGFDDDDDLRH